jgi:hypothetical protein
LIELPIFKKKYGEKYMATISGQFSDEYTVTKYEITDEMKDAIIFRLIDYFEKNGHIGEVIHQCDDAIIEAPSVLSDIADNIIKFEDRSI